MYIFSCLDKREICALCCFEENHSQYSETWQPSYNEIPLYLQMCGKDFLEVDKIGPTFYTP